MALDLAEEQPITEINLTPLVDVSLVLVIIFMIVAPFLSQVIKPIELPKAANAAAIEQDSIKVSLFSDGTAAVDSAIVPFDTLQDDIRNQISSGRKPWIVIRAAADMPHGRVMKVVASLRQAGAQRLSFGANPKVVDEIK